MAILFMSVTPWFFSLANISFLEHWESSLFLITPLGYIFIFKLWKVFIFSKKVFFIFSFNHYCAIS